MSIIFLFVNSNKNNFIYFLLKNGKEEQINFASELLIRASCSRLGLFVTKNKGQSKCNKWEGKSLKERGIAWLTDMYFQL